MNINQIKGYNYIACDNELEFYNKYSSLLNEGYNPIKIIHLSVLLSKNNEKILLSYENLDVNDPMNSLINLVDNKEEYKIKKPGIIGVINSIKHHFNNNIRLDDQDEIVYNKLFDKDYDNVVLLVLDGLGSKVLEKNLGSDAFLSKNKLFDIEAPFPSTTAAALTTIKTGLLPIETGWTGWQNYIKELNKNIILFTGVDYYTNEPTMVTGYDKLPFKYFYDDLGVNAFSIEPDFKNSLGDINEVLNRSKKLLKKHNKQIQYVYWTEPDGIMHEYGTYSNEAKLVLQEIDKKLISYKNSLPSNTLLIITADHGHIPVNPIRLYLCEGLMNTLERKPQNDTRCAAFKIKDGMRQEFDKYFKLFEDVYTIISKEDAYLYMGYKYSNKVNERIDDFIGDVMAITNKNYYFMFKPDDFVMKSHHAGNSFEEMIVPLIVFRS